MIRKSSVWLSDVFCKRGWIDLDSYDWCVYALEKRLGLLLFISAVALWMGISGLYVESMAFLVPFYFLRRRMGGCHAKSSCVCFFISIGLVIFSSSFLGRMLLPLPISILFTLNLICVLFAMHLRPAYPPQIHFSIQEITANYIRKNYLLLLILLIQCLSLILYDKRILVYSQCGIVLCNITVLIEKQKGRRENEKTRKTGRKSS